MSTDNLLSESWTDLDPGELRLLFRERFGGGLSQYDDGKLHLPLAGGTRPGGTSANCYGIFRASRGLLCGIGSRTHQRRPLRRRPKILTGEGGCSSGFSRPPERSRGNGEFPLPLPIITIV